MDHDHLTTALTSTVDPTNANAMWSSISPYHFPLDVPNYDPNHVLHHDQHLVPHLVLLYAQLHISLDISHRHTAQGRDQAKLQSVPNAAAALAGDGF